MDREDREVIAPYFTGKNKALKLTEVLEILQNPDDTRAIVTPPAKPHGGDGYLYRVEADTAEDSWKNDNYYFKHNGSREQPKPAPMVLKQYFVAYKSDGSTTKAFKRQAYNLLEGDVKYMLVHYIGKCTVALSDPKYEKRLNTALHHESQIVNSYARITGSGDEDGGDWETRDMECDHDRANTNSPTFLASLDEVSSRKRTHNPDMVNRVKTPKRSENERVIENNLMDITTECVSHQHDERPTNLKSLTEYLLNKRTHVVIARRVLKQTKYWEKSTRFSTFDSPCLSLIADIDCKWRNDLTEVSGRLKWSRLSPDVLGEDQCKETYDRLVSAVIVGAYHMKTDITEFVDTLYMYPSHVLGDNPITDDDDGTDPQMCKVGPYNIQRNYLLDQTAWLGDEVMNAYMHVLKTTWNRIHSLHCAVLDSFLVNHWEKDEYDVHPCKEELGTYTWILMPANMPLNQHWVLLVANVQDGTVGVVNSMPALDVGDKLIQHWRKYTRSLRKGDGSVVTWTKTDYPVLSQRDGHSCGVFVNMAAEAVLSEVPPSVMRSCHTVWYRKYIWRRLREYAGEHIPLDTDTRMLESPCEKLTNNPASTKARTFAYTIVNMSTSIDDTRYSLHKAASLGDIRRMHLLIDQGESVESTDDRGWTPLHCACENGHVEAVSDLVSRRTGDVQNRAQLTLYNPDLSTEYVHLAGTYPLHIACLNGHENLAHILMNSEANVEDKSENGMTALFFASANGHESVAALLIKNGASVTAEDKDGWTALHVACQNGHESVAALLIKNGAIVTAEDKDGRTALHVACHNGHESVAALLIKNGASVTAEDEDGWTALDLACQNGHESVAALLIKNGASVTAVTTDGMTALHVACHNGHESVAALLIKNGASVTAEDKDGRNTETSLKMFGNPQTQPELPLGDIPQQFSPFVNNLSGCVSNDNNRIHHTTVEAMPSTTQSPSVWGQTSFNVQRQGREQYCTRLGHGYGDTITLQAPLCGLDSQPLGWVSNIPFTHRNPIVARPTTGPLNIVPIEHPGGVTGSSNTQMICGFPTTTYPRTIQADPPPSDFLSALQPDMNASMPGQVMSPLNVISIQNPPGISTPTRGWAANSFDRNFSVPNEAVPRTTGNSLIFPL